MPVSPGSRGEESSEEDPPIDITTVQDMLSSHHYKSFKISMIHKLRFTTEVQLGTHCSAPCCAALRCVVVSALSTICETLYLLATVGNDH